MFNLMFKVKPINYTNEALQGSCLCDTRSFKGN